MEPLNRISGVRFKRYLPLVGLALYIAWILVAPPSFARSLVGSLGAIASLAAAAALLLSAAHRYQLDRAWTNIALGMALWAIALAIALVIQLIVNSTEPLPSLGDWLALSGALAVLAGLAAFSRRSAERFGRIRGVLDLVIIGLALGTLAWVVFLRPIFAASLAEPIRMVWATATPVLVLILSGLVIQLALSTHNMVEVRSFILLSTGLLIMSVAELGDALRRLQEVAIAGGIVEAAWIASGLVFLEVTRSLVPERFPDVKVSPRRARWLETFLPIALTYIVTGTVVVGWLLSQQVDWLGVIAAAILALLLMARQGILIGQVELRKYAELVNASADMAFVSDADGNLILGNPALLKAVGRPTDEMSLGDIFDFEQDMASFMDNALENGWEGEVNLRSPNFPVYLALRPVQDERRALPMLAGTAHDLRSVKRRQEELETLLSEVAEARSALEALNQDLETKVNERTQQLEQTIMDLAHLNEELEELDRMKNEFVALVSHELRAPLTNIQTGLELVLENEPEISSDAANSLSLVQEEVDRLSHLVEAILDLSALEARRFPLHLATVDLHQVTGEVLAHFPEIESIRTEIPDDLPPIAADEHGLKSVLTHLIDNAAKYAPEGDIQLKAEVENGSVKITLSDAGPGIPVDERERIFEMFHRLDTSDAREIYGYGLGLPMSRRLIEAMGGELRVDENEEKRTEFAFWLPQAEHARD